MFTERPGQGSKQTRDPPSPQDLLKAGKKDEAFLRTQDKCYGVEGRHTFGPGSFCARSGHGKVKSSKVPEQEYTHTFGPTTLPRNAPGPTQGWKERKMEFFVNDQDKG